MLQEKKTLSAYLNILMINMLCTLCLMGKDKIDQNLWHLAYVDFDSSMGKGSEAYEQKFKKKSNRKLLKFLQELYEENQDKFLNSSSKLKIPRIIHQIWIGGKPLPDFYKKLTKTWIKHHPDWEYILWDDAKVKQLGLLNQKFYDAATSMSEKANILRYEVLDRFGGMYADIDCECLKSFDILHTSFDFYTGICPADCVCMLQNAVIGCAPSHPIINKCKETLGKNMNEASQYLRNGILFFSAVFSSIVNKIDSVSIALPATFFYPINKYDLDNKAATKIYPESFCIHYWGETIEKKMALQNKVKNDRASQK